MISRAGNTLGQDKYVKYVFLLLVCLIGCLSFVWIESYYSCKMVIIYTVCPIFHMSNYPILHCTFHFQLSTHKFPLYIPLIYTIYIYIYIHCIFHGSFNSESVNLPFSYHFSILLRINHRVNPPGGAAMLPAEGHWCGLLGRQEGGHGVISA